MYGIFSLFHFKRVLYKIFARGKSIINFFQSNPNSSNTLYSESRKSSSSRILLYMMTRILSLNLGVNWCNSRRNDNAAAIGATGGTGCGTQIEPPLLLWGGSIIWVPHPEHDGRKYVLIFTWFWFDCILYRVTFFKLLEMIEK